MNFIRRKLQAVRRSAQKGFTLIELAIVGIFLGLLAIFAITQFSGSATDSTKANGMFEATTKIADNWALIAQSCGTSNDITAVDLTADNGTASSAIAAAAANLDMLLGVTAVHDDFKGCYATSGVRPLVGVANGTAGQETIQGFRVTASNTTIVGRNALTLQFGNSDKYVPDTLILPLYNKYSSVSGASSATAIADTANTDDKVIRFGDKATRTLTLVRAL